MGKTCVCLYRLPSIQSGVGCNGVTGSGIRLAPYVTVTSILTMLIEVWVSHPLLGTTSSAVRFLGLCKILFVSDTHSSLTVTHSYTAECCRVLLDIVQGVWTPLDAPQGWMLFTLRAELLTAWFPGLHWTDKQAAGPSCTVAPPIFKATGPLCTVLQLLTGLNIENTYKI